MLNMRLPTEWIRHQGSFQVCYILAVPVQFVSQNHTQHGPLDRYVKLRVVHAPGMPGTFFTPPRVSDPDMHHGTCVTHVPWCMPGSLTSDFLWSRWRGKRSRHSQRMRNAQFYVSGKMPIPQKLSSFYRLTLWHVTSCLILCGVAVSMLLEMALVRIYNLPQKLHDNFWSSNTKLGNHVPFPLLAVHKSPDCMLYYNSVSLDKSERIVRF